jgi:hypothetical protein
MTVDEGNKVLYSNAVVEKKSLLKNIKVSNSSYRKDYIIIKKKIGGENVIMDQQFKASQNVRQRSLESLKNNIDFSSEAGSNQELDDLDEREREFKRLNTIEKMHAFMDKR